MGKEWIRELASTSQQKMIQNELVVGNERGGYFMNLVLEMKEEISGLNIHTTRVMKYGFANLIYRTSVT